MIDLNTIKKIGVIFLGGCVSATVAQSASYITGGHLDWRALLSIAVIGGIKAITLVQTKPIS